MRLSKALSIMACLVAVCLFAMPSAIADSTNRETKVTFSAPVEIPGGVGAHVLPAGTYVFKLLDSPTNRSIVQIFNEDKTHIFTTVLAIPNYRMKPTGKTVMTFKEQPEGTPETLRTWFYPGDTFGQEFVYRRSRAVELAKVSNEPIPAIAMETELTETELKTVPVETVAPPTVAAAAVEPASAPAPEPVAAAPAAPAELPQTASDVPLVGMIGLFSLVAGAALSLFGKKRLGRAER
jgi:LPXTG-motif cell wall-anchored protein